MEIQRIVRWLALVVTVLALASPAVLPRQFSWAPTLAVAGLILDILGAFTVTWSVIKLHAAELYRRSLSPFPLDRESWWRNFPGAVAQWFGEPLLVVPTTVTAAEDLEDAILGLLMFAGGFVGQAAAVIIAWMGAW